MKRVWKRMLTVLLAGLLLCGMAPMGIADILLVTASATESGMCGENLTWMLTADGVLTVSGTGDMANYSDGEQPWVTHRYEVKTIALGDGVTSIGEDAFAYCENLEEITIPGSVTRIASGAFWACSSLTSITIPNGVTSIGNGAFEGSALTSIIIPDNVTSIGEHTFWYCSNLKNVTIGKGVTSIGSDTFSGCTSLISITIPNSVTSIGWYAFEDCTSLVNVTIPDGVTSIGNSAFSGCTSLASITIPDSVTSIEYGAFENCVSLLRVTIPSSVTNIGYAFLGCTGLSSITVDAHNTAYCSDAAGVLYNKDKSELIQYPIGNPRASFAIPNGVASIEWYAFEDCTSLAHVTIPDSVTSIGSFAFSGCTKLTSVTIPDSVTSIGDWVFSYCESLPDITVDTRNTAYCSDASGVLYNKDKTILFQYPVGNPRTTFTIPNSVTNIENGAFGGCMNLLKIQLPNSMTSIGMNALNSCTSLESIIIPNSVTTIDAWAFSDCTSLKSIVIPTSVTSIGYRAFMNCTNLSDVYYSGSEAQWNDIDIEYGSGDLIDAMIYYNWFEEPIVRIQNFTATRTVDYRTTITFSAEPIENPVDGAEVHWFINNQDKGASEQYTEKEAKATYTVQAKYMKDGKILAESEIETVNVKAGFFAKLKAFFRALFGRLPKVVQDYVGIEVIDRTLS